MLCVFENAAGNTYLGIASGAYPLATAPFPPPATPFAVYYNAGQMLLDSGIGATIGAHVTGDVLGYEVSFAASQVRVFLNNVLQTTSTFASGSAMFPFFHSTGSSGYAHSMTLRTLAADQTYPSRSGGYVAWDYMLPQVGNFRLREDGSYTLREGGGRRIRESD